MSQLRPLLLLLAASVVLECGDTAKRPKVLLVGLDGVRADVLASAWTPHIDSLIADGYFSDRATTRPPTVSGPGWSSMLTGVWAEKHGVTSNDFTPNRYQVYPDFLSRLEQVDSGFRTLAVMDWSPLGTRASGGPLLGDAIDVKLVIDGDAEPGGYQAADRRVVATAVEHLALGDPDAAFVYLGNIDVVGHETSSLSPDYRAAIEEADSLLGLLLAAVRRRASYAREEWLILMSTDHGRRDDGGHGGASDLERRIFYLASGPSAQRGPAGQAPEIVDVAVTALAHLGVGAQPAWSLDGRARGLRRRQR